MLTEEPLLVELVRLPRDVASEAIREALAEVPPDRQVHLIAMLMDAAKLLPRPLGSVVQAAVMSAAKDVPGAEIVVAANMLWSTLVSILSLLPVATLTALLASKPDISI